MKVTKVEFTPVKVNSHPSLLGFALVIVEGGVCIDGIGVHRNKGSKHTGIISLSFPLSSKGRQAVYPVSPSAMSDIVRAIQRKVEEANVL